MYGIHMGKLEYRVRMQSPKAWQLGEGTIVYRKEGTKIPFQNTGDLASTR